MKKLFFYIGLMCFIAPTARAMFCSTPQGSNGWIEEGMSASEIIAACGQPNNQAQIEKTDKRLRTTQYWTYQQQTVQVMPQGPAPLAAVKMTTAPNMLVVEINGNNITHLALNGEFVSSANCPNGGFIRVGDSIDVLVSRCDNNAQISYQHQTEDSTEPPVTVWTYQLGNGAAPLQVQFENGVVSQISD